MDAGAFIAAGHGHRDRSRRAVHMAVIGRHRELELRRLALAQSGGMLAGGEAVIAGLGVQGEGAVVIGHAGADIGAMGVHQMEAVAVIDIHITDRGMPRHGAGLAHGEVVHMDAGAVVQTVNGNVEGAHIAGGAVAVGSLHMEGVGDAFAHTQRLGGVIGDEGILAGIGIDSHGAVFVGDGIHHRASVIHQMEGHGIMVRIGGGDAAADGAGLIGADAARRGNGRRVIGAGDIHRALGRGRAAMAVGDGYLEAVADLHALAEANRRVIGLEGIVAGGGIQSHRTMGGFQGGDGAAIGI